MAVREQEQAQPAERAAARRLGVLRQAALASTLLVGVLGGVAVWRAVDRLDDAWGRHAVVQGEMADLKAVIGARLNEAVGVVGLDSGSPTDDPELQAQLDEVFEWAGTRDAALGEDVIAREAELVDAAEASGAVDERLLSRLESTLRELDREVTRPTSEAAQAAHDDARYTVVVVVVLSAGLGGAAAWLGRRLRAQEAPAGNEPTPHRT